MIKKIGVAGAGTMGSGIALSAAQSNFSVILFDTSCDVLEKAKQGIAANLQFLVDKNKISAEQSAAIAGRIYFSSSVADCKADVIIEAIIEKMPAKISLFRELSSINTKDCIFASNTSSLSITELQENIDHPARVAGLHFFNPAQIMKLVEVVKGNETSAEVINRLMELSRNMGKTPVLCKDVPGFIVNRVARHFYLEAMHLVESGVATFEQVDNVMEASGFKMGPFRLMDLIGMDINLAVSESLYHALDEPARLKPSTLQVDKVKKGHLGRKSGKGFYDY